MNIVIREDFEKLIPPLSDEEYDGLRASLSAEGCRDPLVVWEKGNVLLDGHNRYRICKELKIEFLVNFINPRDEHEVRQWMIENQLGRRNLKPDQASLLRGKVYEIQKIKDAARRGAMARKRTPSTAPIAPPADQPPEEAVPKMGTAPHGSAATAQALGKQFGVSKNTILRDAEFAKEAEAQGVTDDVMAGKVTKKEVMEAAKKKRPAAKKKRPAAEPWEAVAKAYAALSEEQKVKFLEHINYNN